MTHKDFKGKLYQTLMGQPLINQTNCFRTLKKMKSFQFISPNYHYSKSLAQLCLTLCDPMDYTVHGILQARVPERVTLPFSRGSSQPRDQTQVSCIAGGVGSLSLLQWIFLTQESNRGLLHCRWILYQLSYQGSPTIIRIPNCTKTEK